MSDAAGGERTEIDAVAGAPRADERVRHADRERVDVAIVGAGPCGLAAAIAAGRAGLRAVVLERGCLVSGIHGYPTYMTFFSTAERLAIGGIPFSVPTEKPTRRDALAYYRTVARHFALDVRQYETVSAVERVGEAGGEVEGAVAGAGAGTGAVAGTGTGAGTGAVAGTGTGAGTGVVAGTGAGAGAGAAVGANAAGSRARGGPPPDSNIAPPAARSTTDPSPAGARERPVRFRVRSRTRAGRDRVTDTHAVVVATGYFGHPNRLGVPGEELPHVSHLFLEGHVAFGLPVVVVGGGNSAVDAALDLHRAGARVTLVHFAPALDRNVKPWVMPDIANRIAEGSIAARFGSRVTAIEPDAVVLATPAGEERVPADQVYPMLGYQPNSALLVQLGVPIDPVTGIPAHDPATMETAVPGVYMAGVLASGFDANRTFIENGRHHGELIAARLTG